MTTFLKCLFFSQNSTFLKFWKPIWLSIPRGLWPYNFFPDILILRGQNNENITREKIAKIRIAIWGLRSAWIKKLKKIDPHYIFKKRGSALFNFFIRGTVWSQIAIRRRATISHAKFSRFWLLQIKKSDKIFLGHNPLGIVNRIGFWNVKKLISGWKIGTWKIIVCKNPKDFIITSSGFAKFWNSISYTFA